MRKDVRTEILEAAKALFTARGYRGVSMQDIADAVGISKGNLTYHFRKKETIMEALLSRSGEHTHPTAPTTLQGLDDVFSDMQQTIQRYAFYFLHHAELSRLSPAIAELQAVAYRKNTELLRQAFINLRAADIFREELFAGEYDCAIDTLHMTCIYWQPYSELCGNTTAGYRRQAWSVIYRFLTERGLLEIRSVAENVLPYRC